MLRMTEREGEIWVDVRVAPRASRDAVLGEHDGALKVALTAPPVEGAANAALAVLLAKRLGIAKGAVRVVRGETSRQKTVAIRGASTAEIERLVTK
ncbi:MAG: DUF167 domain-containing protein [Polyangiaceae bacterium]|nr:DUF167 domain-containing protein [Polyangiaceae bacterium]